MSVNTNELLALSAEDKLRIIALLWDNLEETTEPFPIPASVLQEGVRRRDEMNADPSLGLSHDDVWKRIADRKNRGD